MSPALDECERIRAALDRILADTPRNCNRALTIVVLALEAQVPGNALTQRYPDLKNDFYAKAKERGAPGGEVRLGKVIADLRKTIANKNQELDQIRADVPALVCTIHQLELQNRELREALEQAGNVIPIRSRRPSGPQP